MSQGFCHRFKQLKNDIAIEDICQHQHVIIRIPQPKSEINQHLTQIKKRLNKKEVSL